MNRFQGLDRDHVALVLGDGVRVPARFEGGHSKEEKMAAVQYLRFSLTPEARAALADPERPARLVVDHPNYQAEAALTPAMRFELLKDLA